MYRIAHLADVHLRPLQRHDEIRVVFNALVEDIRQHKINAVVIAGDIWHSKLSQITPESIQELVYLFTLIANEVDLFVTLGNHDLNLTNLSRQDLITQIHSLVSKQTKHRFELCKYSGVYDINEQIKLCVFSLLDEENWNKVQPQKDKINIASYHGQVSGAKTELDYEIVDGMSVEFFKDYDLTMLGDIHKTQFLDTKLINRKQIPYIAYPGSTLQHTYAEELVHGYLLWDIESKNDFSVEFKVLPNINPFITIDWKGNVKETLKQATYSNARYRVRSDVYISQKDTQELMTLLKNNNNAIEVIFKNDSKISHKLLSSQENAQTVIDNFRDVNVLTRFVQKYHHDQELTSDDLNKIEILVKKYLYQAVDADDITRHTKWSLKKLQFDNMFAYGEKNVINFDKLRGLTGIVGPNRIGKSAIPGTIMYALFNSSDRGSIKNQAICNDHKDYCVTSINFELDNKNYLIERQTVKRENKRGEINSSTVLNFFQILEDGTKDDLVGDGRIETDKLIRKKLGSGDDFEITHLSSQGNSDRLLQYKSTERWNYLAKILDIDLFAKMFKNVHEDIKTYKIQLRNFPDKQWNDLAKELRDNFNDCNIQIQEKTNKLFNLRQQLSEYQIKLNSFNVLETVSIEQVENSRKKLQKYINEKNKVQLQVDQINLEQEEDDAKLTTINSKLPFYNIDYLRQNLLSIQSSQTKTASLQNLLEQQQQIGLTINKSIKLLQTIPCEDKFPDCRFIKSAFQDKQKYDEQKTIIQQAEDILKVEQQTLQNLLQLKAEEHIQLHDSLCSSKNKIEITMLERKTVLSTLNHSIQALLDSIILETNKLTKLEENLKSSENLSILKLQNTLSEINDEIKTLDEEKLQLAINKGKIEASVNKLREEKNKRNELLQNMKLLELIAQAFSKKGIPRVIVSTQLPLINLEIAKILQGIVDYTIEFQEDEETDKLDLFINYGESKRVLELGSGMERMLASIAIRVALINVSSLPRADFFIIDEGFGSLDDVNIEACVRLLKSLDQYFKSVIIISHVDLIKESVDNIIEITKNNNVSCVRFE
jgi:DNA repair exonuclease SbcCD ATPase subunit/DNA repair exonuclease SbcCD nuclease subunit